jgi:hypothetical protein
MWLFLSLKSLLSGIGNTSRFKTFKWPLSILFGGG